MEVPVAYINGTLGGWKKARFIISISANDNTTNTSRRTIAIVQRTIADFLVASVTFQRLNRLLIAANAIMWRWLIKSG
jgi:hypothetical protein